MTRFPREDYAAIELYDPGRAPVAIDLSDNTNLWGPHPAALEVLRSADSGVLTRYPSVYADELKEALAERHGIGLEHFTTGCGTDDLIDAIFRAAAPPPARLAYPTPTFSMAEAFARMNGMEAVPVPWSRAETDPARLLLEEPDVVYLCRPNNPTGAAVGREWILGLLALGGAEGPIVLLDEAYADFALDTLIHEAPHSERLVVLRTLSKAYGLAGLRVGYAVGPAPVVREIEKSRGPYKVGGLAMRAAVAAVLDESGWKSDITVSVAENRERLARELTARGFSPLPSQANFLLLPVEPASAVAVNKALRERGVSARPFPDLPDIGDALRITIGPWEMMEGFLSALDQLLMGGEGEPGDS